MMSILDQMTVKRPQSSFRPTTVRQLFVLRLAQKLGEPAVAEHYAELTRSHTDETLLLAYRHTFNHGHPPRDFARHFHVVLASTKEQKSEDQTDRLLAVKIERRSIALALFVGTRLDFHGVRHLSSQADKAEGSAVGFLSWAIDNLEIGSAALERMTNGNEIRRAVLNLAVLDVLRGNAIPVWEVSKRALLETYGHPPLRSRIELRQAVQEILWARFNTDKPGRQELDAAALGLHVQTERLFLH
jgi:hypothetical protein